MGVIEIFGGMGKNFRVCRYPFYKLKSCKQTKCLRLPYSTILPSASGHPSTQPDTSPSRPTPPSLKSLLNQGLSLADTKSSKEKCAKCFAALRSNTVPVRCNVSTKEFHQKCSTGLTASISDNQWKCEKCTKLQQNRIAASTNCQLPGPTNWSPSQLLPVTFRNKLKTYQWKADGIRPKFVELCNWLINSDIHSLAV